MHTHNTTLMISNSDIAIRVRELAGDIVRDMGEGELCLIGLMNGAFMFMADLARELSRRFIPLLTDFMVVSSYGNDTRSSGRVTVKEDISLDIQGKNVLVIDDILDSGLTIEKVRVRLQEKGAGTVRTCVLLAKERHDRTGPPPDYTGFLVGTGFVVGYRLDFGGRYRELPEIHILHPPAGEDQT